MDNVLTGAAMGAALTFAGVYQPVIIRSQFSFDDYTMLQTFLSAAAGSTLLVTASQTLGLTSLPHRRPAGLLGLWRYDANLLGGALLGAGMAVSGACPGTLLVQLGVGGIPSAPFTLGGALLGGAFWSYVALQRDAKGGQGKGKGTEKKKEEEVEEKKTKAMTETVYGALGVSRMALLLGLEAVFAAALAALARWAPAGAAQARGIEPWAGGLAMAAAQLVSLTLRSKLLGASTVFEEIGGWVWGMRQCTSLLFSAGIVGGAWLLSAAVPSLRPIAHVATSPARAALGGFLVIVGARMAGGCTSGHGISGLSLMSTASFLTVAAIFGAGGLVGLLMH